MEWLVHNAADRTGDYTWLLKRGVLWFMGRYAMASYNKRQRELGLPEQPHWDAFRPRLSKQPYYRPKKQHSVDNCKTSLFGIHVPSAFDAGLDVPSTLGEARVAHLGKEG